MRLRRQGVLTATVLAAALGLAACGSSDPDYYTLTTWPGVAQPGGPLTVEVRTPAVPSGLDRDYIVRSDRDYRLKLAGNAAWSESLADLIGQTLTTDLQQRLPGSTVFAASGAISASPQAVVEFNVSRFAEDQAGNAEVAGTLSVQRPGAPGAQGVAVHVTVPPDNGSVGAFAAALSKLLGQVADQAADSARRLGPAPLQLSNAG